MSKHKRIHNFTGRNYAKFVGFVASRYGPLPKKKTPASSAKADEGKAEKVQEGSDSASTITGNGGLVK